MSKIYSILDDDKYSGEKDGKEKRWSGKAHSEVTFQQKPDERAWAMLDDWRGRVFQAVAASRTKALPPNGDVFGMLGKQQGDQGDWSWVRVENRK